MSTLNICFYGELTIIILQLSPNTQLIWSTVMLLITEIDHSKVVEKVQERNEQLIFSLKLEKSVHGSLNYFKNLMQLTFNFLSFYFCNITRKIL